MTECPYCNMENAYHNGVCFVCPDCDREFGAGVDDEDESVYCPECDSDEVYLDQSGDYTYICDSCGHHFNDDDE